MKNGFGYQSLDIPYVTQPKMGNFSDFSMAMENAASPDNYFTHMQSLTISK
jgi:hypothetical protein